MRISSIESLQRWRHNTQDSNISVLPRFKALRPRKVPSTPSHQDVVNFNRLLSPRSTPLQDLKPTPPTATQTKRKNSKSSPVSSKQPPAPSTWPSRPPNSCNPWEHNPDSSSAKLTLKDKARDSRVSRLHLNPHK